MMYLVSKQRIPYVSVAAEFVVWLFASEDHVSAHAEPQDGDHEPSPRHVRRVSRLRPRVSLRLEADARWRSRRAAPCYRHFSFSSESLSSRARAAFRLKTECARVFVFSKT